MQRNNPHRGIFALGIFLMLGSLAFSYFNQLSLEKIAATASNEVAKKIEISRIALDKALADSSLTSDLTPFYKDQKIGVYTFEGPKLVYWNNSQIPLKENLKDFSADEGFIKLHHGYFFYVVKRTEERASLALCLVKPIYELQNNYLSNNFEEWTGIPAEVEISADPQAQGKVFAGKEVLFGIEGGEQWFHNTENDIISYVVFFLGILLILIAGLAAVKSGTPWRNILIMLGIIFVIRILFLWFRWPAFFYRISLYDLRTFGNAQSFFNGYLGDILLNSALLLFAALIFHFYYEGREQLKGKKYLRYIFLFVLLVVLVNSFNHTVKSLVSNSTLNFDFLNVFSVKLPAFVGLMSLCLYSIALFISTYHLVRLFTGEFGRDLLLFLGFNLAVCVVQIFVEEHDFLFENFWLMIFSVTMFLLLRYRPGSISLALGVQILIMAVITSRFLNTYIEKNQVDELDILAMKLSERQDPILESEFSSLPPKIRRDPNLGNLLRILPSSAEGIETILKQKFFSGYFDRYNLDFALFDINCNPLMPVQNGLLNNQGFFEDEIRMRSDSTLIANLFFVTSYQKNTRYIAKINLEDKNLYILMEAKQFEELGSFPDLLLDRSQQKPEKLRTLSHAVYRAQQLAGHYGDLNYPFFLQDSSTLSSSHPDHINRFFYPDNDSVIIISERAKTWNYFFTFNSYLLLFFSLITYSSYLIYASFFTSQFKNPSLTRRIQTIIIVLLLVAMSAIGYTSGSLVTNQFSQDNKKLLEEKTQVIINELSAQFSPRQFFEESRRELINLKLKEYARLFNTPISLFDHNGFLYNTSESKLYDLGLAAVLVNPEAYQNLKNNRSSAESVDEKAGALTYLSFYTPLFDNNKQLLGFVNLPYFAKQSALENELSGIISALINVYVILFVISILAGLILSGYITQPLRLIKQQIANISLGKQNEKISWQSNDEIGRLVSEYNEMLVKLENSAQLLAQSERESAWREMAKQVAHEIKNPLTPMKLNLQYLMHVMKSEPDNFKEKFEKSAQGIIEQIDSLANIATEFSNFAKLPVADLRTINLVDVISTSLLLFENQKGIEIRNSIPEVQIMVKGDHDQCLRVFNNIFKNAVQALEESPEPVIGLSCMREDKNVVVAVKDNGCGVDEELKTRLFTPNFTTKSTGSGLGLAMVKNIMEGFGGKIWFESEKDKGSVFYLSFPVIE